MTHEDMFGKIPFYLFFCCLCGCSSSKIISIDSGLLIDPINIKGSTSNGITSRIDFAVLKIFFATNRNLANDSDPGTCLGSMRSNLKYGTCYVSIPRDHTMGEEERPSVWRLEFQENPKNHIMVRKVVIQPKNNFIKDLRSRVAESSSREAFVFIHGFNVAFAEAARATAQLAYDLSFNGAPVLYSWPSKESLSGYAADEATIEWSEAHFTSFLTEFLKNSTAEKVHLIAHSMGNRALSRGVINVVSKNPSLKNRISEIILTAPDIDQDLFRDYLAPSLTKIGSRITLYSTSNDIALNVSKTFHGNVGRAGDVKGGYNIYDGIQTIDATNVNTSFIGHATFRESRTLLSDIYYILKDHAHPDVRVGLRRVAHLNASYWEFKP